MGWRRRRKEPARVRLAVELAENDADQHAGGAYRYEVEVGFSPVMASAAFQAEPQIKVETISHVGRSRTVRLIDRRGPSVMVRTVDGRPEQVDIDLLDSETVLGRLEEPTRHPELDAVRRAMLQWRFYYGLRTDAQSPLRHPCPAVATTTLASDGSDLAAVFATLVHIRQDTVELTSAIDAAFPGAKLVSPEPDRLARFGLLFPEFPGRLFEPQELSDGTLRYLALTGALLSYRLPPFVALNEPEASLHPDLMKPLAHLVVRASERAQIWLVTHSSGLAEAITAASGQQVRVVGKKNGATEIGGLKAWGEFPDADDEK